MTASWLRRGRCGWSLSILSVAFLVPVSPAGIAGQCQIQRLEVPVTMQGVNPTITAQINGRDALFIIDSGSWGSTITPAAAEQYQLHPKQQFRSSTTVATVDTFTIFNTPVLKFDFPLGGNERGVAGSLGQNILRVADIEYDMANATVRILKTTDCRKANLAYWARSGESYSVMDIEPASAVAPLTIGTAYLNGAKIRVTFETGATASVVGLRAAERAGIKPGGPGVDEAGEVIAGHSRLRAWIANFPSLRIGDEEVHNARLRFADLGNEDMVLGADFFLSHHVYVASSQSKLFFTYNGGPVFNYAAAVAQAKAAGAMPEAAVPAPDADPSAAADAPALARRAAAYAARRDFEHALQDYDRACALAPNEASYFYQRALIRLSLHRNDAGAADIETALKLNPEYADAYFVRAQFRLSNHATADAVSDLNSVDRLAAKQAAIRYGLASLYSAANEPQSAIRQLDLWVAHHPDDVNLPDALNTLCWDRAVLNQDLDRALDDCNRALRLRRRSYAFLESRGFVYLRRKEFDKAIGDYDAALKIDPKAAWALYCRGLAKSRAGKAKEGASDMTAALARDPNVGERAKGYSLE
jgi:tetratricopeptide (TPR) repeat protein